jgi:hypothetical protein
MNIGSGFLGQSSNKSITPSTMGQILGADMVKEGAHNMMSVGGQGIVGRGLENLRQKGAMVSNEYNFQTNMYRDQQRLLGEELNYNKQFGMEKERINAATAQRKIETDAATSLEETRTADRFKRDQTEFDRRLAEEKKAKEQPRTDAKADIASASSGTLEGIKAQWEADLQASQFDDEGDYNSFNDDGTIQLNEDGTPVTNAGSSKRDKINAHFNRIMEQAKGISDPVAQRAFIERMQTSGHLNITNVRGMYDPVFREAEAKRKKEEAGSPAIGGGLRSEAK